MNESIGLKMSQSGSWYLAKILTEHSLVISLYDSPPPPPPFCFVFFQFKRNYILAYNSKRYHPKCNFWANFILSHVKKNQQCFSVVYTLIYRQWYLSSQWSKFVAVPGEFIIFKSKFRSHPCLRAEISIAWHIEASSFICTLQRQISQSDCEITANWGYSGARRA